MAERTEWQFLGQTEIVAQVAPIAGSTLALTKARDRQLLRRVGCLRFRANAAGLDRIDHKTNRSRLGALHRITTQAACKTRSSNPIKVNDAF